MLPAVTVSVVPRLSVSVASAGIPEILIETVSVGLTGVSLMPSATVPSSLTDSVGLAIVRVGACAFTVSAMVCGAEVAVPLEAVTARVALVSPACSVRPASSAGVSVMLPAVTVSVVPRLSVSVASAGIPEILIETVSVGLTGVSLMPSATVPSSPASTARRIGDRQRRCC